MRDTRTSFSLTKFPNAQYFQYFILFLGLAGVFFSLPTIVLPTLGGSDHIRSLIAKTSDYELTNEIQAGQFRLSTHKGDTHTTSDATFYGISILTSSRAQSIASLKSETKAKTFVQALEAKDFNKNAKDFYQGIVLLKQLGSFNSKKSEKYYSTILQLAEPNSGFRMDSSRSASVAATYYAFEAIEELGKFDEFKSTEQYKAAVTFVSSLKENILGGFSDVAGQNATLEATYYGFQLVDAENRTGVEQFVYACQAQDGGFSDEPIDSLARYYYSESDLVSTLRGIYILQSLGVSSSSPLDFSSPYANAKAFLQSQLCGNIGLEATYHLLELTQTFSSFSFGPSKYLQFSVLSIGGLFLVLSLFAFYRPQIPDDSLTGAPRQVFNVLVLLALGAVSTHYFSSFIIFPYLALSLYLVVQYYETQLIDTTDGVMILVACVNSLVYMGLVASFVYFSPFVYGQALTFVILLGWSVLSAFLTSYGACFFVGRAQQRINFFVKAGFLAWVTNTFLLFLFLHGRGDMHVFYRLVAIRGIYPIVFVSFPVLSLILSYFGSCVGFLTWKSYK